MQKSRYFKVGLTVFCTVAAILLFSDTLFGRGVLLKLLTELIGALKPVIIGGLIAYLLAPIVDFFEGKTGLKTGKLHTKGRRVAFGVRVMSILLTWCIIAVLIYLLASILVPEVYQSILQLFSNIENYYNTINGWIKNLLDSNPELEAWVAEQVDNYYVMLQHWIKTDLLPQTKTLMSIVSGSVFGIVGFFSDLLVSIIVSVYFLTTKELCGAHTRKILYSLLPQNNVYWLLRGVRKADRIFAGFVRGKLLDSLIIGILCFIGCSIMKFPYTPLVSVIVGVTNVIPFFGPFLGAIPSTILILLADPLKALYFAIFVLALQQLDGNVIGPKILGDKTGLSSIWVIVAILVGGHFFGFAGMFFGVPVCACLYSLGNFFVDVRLRKKDMSLKTEDYLAEIPKEPLKK